MVLEALDRAVGEDAPVGSAITAAQKAQASPTMVPVERYTAPEFAARELERMWPKVWQVACTVDHVSDPGDYFEYRVGPFSVLIVRDDDGIHVYYGVTDSGLSEEWLALVEEPRRE